MTLYNCLVIQIVGMSLAYAIIKVAEAVIDPVKWPNPARSTVIILTVLWPLIVGVLLVGLYRTALKERAR